MSDHLETVRRLVEHIDGHQAYAGSEVAWVGNAALKARPALASLIAELEALRKVVGALPRDANGATIQIGDKVSHYMLEAPMYVQSYQKIKGQWWLTLYNVAIVTLNDPDEESCMQDAIEVEVIKEADEAAAKNT